MSRTRQGLNCTLSYLYKGQRRAYQVRANVLTHGMKVIYDESQARVRRVFYPHRLSSAQFMVNVQVVGDAEYASFVNWLTRYADYLLDPKLASNGFPAMQVSIPSRDFLRNGVPLNGYEWQDTVGKMFWDIPLTFETVGEPGEKAPKNSTVGGIALYGDETKYFYPTGVQLSGDQTPPDQAAAGAITITDVRPEAYDSTGTQRRAGGITK